MSAVATYSSPEYWEEALAYLKQRGVSMAEPCEFHLRELVTEGQRRLEQMPAYEQRQRAEEVRRNLFQFIDEMIAEKDKLGLAELHEPTFFAALKKLCPLFPFC